MRTTGAARLDSGAGDFRANGKARSGRIGSGIRFGALEHDVDTAFDFKRLAAPGSGRNADDNVRQLYPGAGVSFDLYPDPVPHRIDQGGK